MSPAQSRSPNIVYIHAHDLGRYCQPMGYDIPAPNLMRIARQGVLFRHCFASAPSCAPSRAALVTGQYPHEVANLAASEDHAKVLHKMRARLDEWMSSTGDPLAERIIPPPPVKEA